MPARRQYRRMLSKGKGGVSEQITKSPAESRGPKPLNVFRRLGPAEAFGAVKAA